MRRFLFFVVCLVVVTVVTEAKTIYDIKGEELTHLFQQGKAKYVIRFEHQFKDTLFVPQNSEIHFDGGRLWGPIVFKNTKLSGNVNLKGSSICGHVRNKVFNASWLCAMDGVSDDAQNINDAIETCSCVYFPKGTYRLISSFKSKHCYPQYLQGISKCHIVIFKDNVTLEGTRGTVFVTNQPIGVIGVFSRPYQIENSVRNIKIRNISFNVQNNGKIFYEFAHVIKLVGVNNIKVESCVFNDFWGDAISLSHYGDTPETGERSLNQNVKILNNTIIGGNHHNNRNGISIASGRNVLIKNNTISNTSRDDMPGGIDVEPNNSAYTVENISIERNNIEGCKGTAGAIGIVMLNDSAPGYHIYIKSNIIRNCSNGIAVALKTKESTSDLIIQGNYIAEDTRPYNFVHDGTSRNWKIIGNIFERPCIQNIPGNIKVDNLVVKGNKKKE